MRRKAAAALVVLGVVTAGSGAALTVRSLAPPRAQAATAMPAFLVTAPVPVAPAGAGVAPITVALPGLGPGVRAPVVAVSVGPDGALAVPDDPSVLGWWSSGAGMADPAGSIVIDGHVDSAHEGLGFFVNLADLDPGDPVAVTDSAGAGTSWRVTAVERYPAAALPAQEVFSRDSPRRLVLITCGGVFDRATHTYHDNLVVYAEPEPVARPAFSDAGEMHDLGLST